MANNMVEGSMPKINPFSYPSETCECGCEIFVPGIIFKKIPGVAVGQGAEEVEYPIKIFYCSKCGKLSPSDQKIMDEALKSSEQAKKSNLII